MLIVDAQVHIWAANTPGRPWVPTPYRVHREVPFTKDDLLREMDAAGVHRAMLAPPPLEGDRNDLVLEASRQHPDRFCAMGLLDIDRPSERSRIARWREEPGMRALRLNFKTQGDPSQDWLWAEAEAAGVPVVLAIAHEQMPLLGEAAARHPGVKITVMHLGLDQRDKDEAAFVQYDRLLSLAVHPNISVNASCLPFYTTDTYPYRRLHPYIRRAYDAFGPRRMFWGTDLTRLPCSYSQAITLFTEELAWLSASDKEWIMGRGFCEWFEWE